MSLSKQLGLGFFFVLLFTFLGTLWMNTQNTRDFIEQQLESHAQDTATSLGLSITPYIGNEEDLPIIETMINAIFDRGYYTSIELVDENGDVLYEKSSSQNLRDIPPWFIDRFALNAPSTSTDINDGWSIKGTLNVTSNTKLGYEQLWQNAVQSAIVSAIAFTLAIIFVWFLVKKVISIPINKVILQADAVTNKQFDQITEIPATTELRKIVNAINVMSEKLFVIFKKMANQSEEYRRFAYADFVTGVGNRRAFELAINQLLKDDVNRPEGHVFLVRASSLKLVHTKLGGEAGDTYLKSVCNAIKEAARSEYEHFSIFRVNGADFALIIENTREANAKAMAQLISIYTKRIDKNEYESGVAHIGAAQFNADDTFKQLMERADTALLSASELEKRWDIVGVNQAAYSSTEWKNIIKDILDHGKADFVSQAILSKNENILYEEWFARFKDLKTSESIPMTQLIPASVRLDYAEQLDKLIIRNLLAQAPEVGRRIGVNINRISLFSPTFIQWLEEQLNVYRSVCPNIIVEIPERALLHDNEALAELCVTLRSYGIKICVEHFGAQLAGISHIRNIMPDYIKLHGQFIDNIHKEPDNQLFVKSLINIGQSLDIKVIAERIESQEDYLWLLKAGVDGTQGFHVSDLKPVVNVLDTAKE